MQRITECFDEWNAAKKEIHFDEERLSHVFLNEREIWYVRLGINIGYEENRKREFLRPVLVLKKVGNLFFVVALTSK
ncbi:MAG: hypothetical protein WCJ45_00935 [bacterium]